MGDHILELAEVGKSFGGVRALDGVSFAVSRGEIHGVCGENGAGKSTLMKIIAGVYPWGAYEGEVRLDGRPLRLERDAIGQARAAGIALVHQELALAPDLTVGENIHLGREPARLGFINWHRLYAEARRTLERHGLNLPLTARVGDLPVGRQQMVEIARALAGEARLLILDEPTSALAQAETAALLNILRGLRASGETCLYISHRLEELLEITDRITVLRDGRLAGTVVTAETDTEELISLMVGRRMTERFPAGSRRPGRVVLSVRGLTARDPGRGGRQVLHDVSFDLRAGEILGVAGLMGSGRSELAHALFGAYGRHASGRVSLGGRELTLGSPRQAMAAGLALVPEDRKRQGLVMGQSILGNLALPNLERFAGWGRIDRHRQRAECGRAAAGLGVKAPSLAALVDALSGGNQQKVVIAKWLVGEPRVLILDEPTRGVDVGAKYEIYKHMNRLAGQGVGIIMVSSEMPEVLGMSDRVLVMHQGAAAGLVEAARATQEGVMALATGTTRTGGEARVS